MSDATPLRRWHAYQELPAWGTADAPPTEFVIFPFGPSNATMFDGRRKTVYLTPENALRIVSEYQRRQIKAAADFNHKLAEAAAWFDIEVRSDGLWATHVEWTPEMLAGFSGKKWRYFSPYFQTKEFEGKHYITALLNFAVTNFPATDNQRPLIALSRTTARRYTAMTADEAKAIADKYIKLCKGDSSFVDALALAILADESAEPGEMPPADPNADPMAATNAEEKMVAQVAFQVTGLRGKEAVGALKKFTTLVTERDAAVKEAKQLRHTTFVEECIKAHKITPAQRDTALADDPDEFRGSMKWANPVVDNTEFTARTSTTNQGARPTLEDLEKQPELLAYCARVGTDPKLYAKAWLPLGIPFSE